ncbi:MAG: DUF2500 domain-containing protein [Oscillospiraceae bacterium]|nr:DUF2500 domain-containing protein [Oscillospiraceae bacterium]
MQENASEIVNWVIVALAMLLTLTVLARLLIKAFGHKFVPVRTVRAKVIKKYRQEVFSQYAGTGKRYRYVVTFLAEGKRLSFYVSELSFGNYKENETGTLKYRGDRFIDFC